MVLELKIEIDHKIHPLMDHNYIKVNRGVNLKIDAKKESTNNNEKIVKQQLSNDHNYFLPNINIVKNKQKIQQHLKEHSYCKPSFLGLENNHLPEKNSNISQNEAVTNKEKNNNETIKIIENQVPVQQLEDLTLVHSKEEASTYTILPGVRLNSQVFMDNLNHRYYKCCKRKDKIYLVCENKKNKVKSCPVLATISIDLNDNRIKTTGPHKHLPRQVNIPMLFFRRAIAIEASKTELLSTSVRQLYDQEIARNPEGAKNYSILQSQMSVRKRRYRSRRLNKPENIQETPNIPRQDILENNLRTFVKLNQFNKFDTLDMSNKVDKLDETERPNKLAKMDMSVRSDKLNKLDILFNTTTTTVPFTFMNPLPSISNLSAQLVQYSKDVQITTTSQIDIDQTLPKNPMPKNYSYTIISDVQQSSRTFIDNLFYKYYKYSNNNNIVYLECEFHKKKKSEFCPVTASINIGSKDRELKLSGLHTHLPPKNSI
ncbi:Hypothetical protein CINCED_3A001911 [Cinara cedri]|uniref:FLYWCH-type domain-containing protein n=1 Tax=Cinara cedri TaxID=506608 RepID=A0A5E4NQG5_9HEMI|nr:Hypothetical protein CINCED_3A001911 [Cinara cedri]